MIGRIDARRVINKICIDQAAGLRKLDPPSLCEPKVSTFSYRLAAQFVSIHAQHVVRQVVQTGEITTHAVQSALGELRGPDGGLTRAINKAVGFALDTQEASGKWSGSSSPRIFETAIVAVALGVLGSRDRKSITVIGSQVNLAARLQAQAGPGQLLLDQATYDQLGETKKDYAETALTLKGFSAPVPAFRCYR